jgi:hypothetical protein
MATGDLKFNPSSKAGQYFLQVLKDKATPGKQDVAYHDILGNVGLVPTGKRTFKFADPWDFDLHKGENLDKGKNVARYIISKLMRPVTVSGEFRVPKG